MFENIFINIVNQAIKYNLIDGTTFYTDSTHKKANANKNKYDDVIEKNIKERSFADSKQNHGYRYAMYKGVKKTNTIHGLFVLLKI